MKNLFKSLVVGALLLGSVGCSDMFKEDLYEINNEIDKINQRIDSLCNAVNTNIASLQTIIDVMQDNDYVDSITPIVEGGETVGYEIVFTQSGSVKIYHGKKGETGATGHTPVVSVKQAEDGRWYWTVDGEYLLDGDGDKILAEAIDGEDGATGADGITPQLKVEGDYWYISYDNKATWERLGKATGEAGKDGDSMFKSVTYNNEYVELVLVDGTVLRIPTWASHMLLVDEIAKINSNISAIQAAVEALESNDYVQKVTPVKDNEGNVVGYTLQFAYAGDVTIYHGEDGKDGEDGEDGKDGVDGKDGYTPVISVKLGEDGVWYWTIDNEWMLDPDGNRIRTTGKDGHQGVDGKPGEPGLDGKDGITPEFKIEDDYWYVSYDKGQTWTKLGKAKGEDGAAGSAGSAGDAFFKGVDTSNEYYIILTLANGTEIKIPTWKTYQELEDKINHLMTNVQSLQSIIKAMQENDYITKVEPIIDFQTNEEIGYTFHFYKGGKIDIYHGKDGKAPEIGIKNHPKLGLCWTFNGEYIIDPTTQLPVALPKDGEDGKDGVTPMLKIVNGEWWMSTNGGKTWTSIGQATGDTGAAGGAGDSFFKSIVPEYATDANGNVLKDSYGKPIVAYIVMTLAGENEGEDVVYKVPTEYITSDINKRLAAIEAQFSTISTIVNALQNAEYIKEVVELYEGPALVGYEITFVKYAIGADGKLTETTRKSTIRNGGAGAAGTVVAAQYDEATDTWYWTLDGQPLKDKDGNYVAINGRPGQSGVTPKMQINKDTNEWEVSYDNGKTWESTGVKATGPQGPQGNPGQGGAAGDSFFAGVSKDGDYWVFELVSGEKIMVPTAEAFASLAERVAALEKSAESILSLVNGKKYIESCEPFSNDTGSGYHLVLVSLNAETGEATKEDCFIYNGIAGNTPVVGLRQDEATGDWYWTVDGEDLLVDGKPVKANGPQGIDGPVPTFRIDPENGHLYVTVNGEEEDLGRVVGTNGSAGEAGTDSSINVDTAEDGKVTITFIGGDGKTSTIEVPSWAVFVTVRDAVVELNDKVEALSDFVEGKSYITNIEECTKTDENGVTKTGFRISYVIYTDGQASEVQTKEIYNGIDGTNGHTPEMGLRQDETTGDWFWTVDGEDLLVNGNPVKANGADGVDAPVPSFEINVLGELVVTIGDETINLGKVVGTNGTAGTNSSIKVTEGEDGMIKIEFIVGENTTNTIYVPSWDAFVIVRDAVADLNETVEALSDFIEGKSYITNVEDCTKTDENGVTKTGYKISYVTYIEGEWKEVSKEIYNGIDGTNGINGETPEMGLRQDEVTGDWFWTVDGEDLLVDGNPVKANGANGKDAPVPSFEINDNGELVVTIGEEVINLGKVVGTDGTHGTNSSIVVTEEEVDGEKTGKITIQFVTGEETTATIVVPSWDEFVKVRNAVGELNDTVKALSDFVEGKSYITNIEECTKTDENGVTKTGFKISYVTYIDGEWNEVSKEIYNGIDGTNGHTPEMGLRPGSPDNNESADDWYWTVDGKDLLINNKPVKANGADGKNAPVPSFNINDKGELVVTIGEEVINLGKVVGTDGTDGTNSSIVVTEEEVDGVKTGKITIQFVTGEETTATIVVPSWDEFVKLKNAVDELNETVGALSDFIEGKSYITNVEDCTKTDENGVTKTGYKISYVTYIEGEWKEVSKKIYNGVDGVNGHNPEIGLRPGNKENGENEEDWYWTIDGNDLLVDGNPVKANGATPSFKIGKAGETGFEAGVLYYTFDDPITEETVWTKIGNVKGDQGTSGLEIVPNEDGTTVSIYYDKNGDGKIDKSDESTELLTTVPKWFNEPSVTFTEGVTNDKVTGATTVKFKVTGSFVGKPEVYAACEGNWSSSVVTVGDLNDEKTEVICSVTVSPTTAYVGDSTLGKLTIYVPYYGKTTIKQVELSAAGTTGLEMQSMPILPKDAEDTKATISFTLDEGDNTPSSNGSCTLVYDFGYTLTDIQTTTEGKEVETGNGFSGSFGGGDWLSTGAYKYDPTTKKITQEIDIQPYIDLKATSPRVAAVIVYSPSGREVSRFIIKQDKVNVINLAENESANCYIISEPGYYKFPVVKGNTNTRVVNGDDLTKDIFDDTHINGGNNPIDILAYDDNYVYFKVDAESINPGNSLITVKDGNNIAWSWHLWFNAPANRADDPNILDTYPNNKGTVMNRSLGAISPDLDYQVLGYDLSYWKDGLYYQWGRKDPLVLSTQSDVQVIPTDRIISGNNYSLSIQNPSKLIDDWSAPNGGWTDKNNKNAKQVDDPCPPGYKVPSQSLWTESDESDLLSLESIFGTFESVYPYNLALSTEMNQNIVFPYSGEVSLSNAQDNVGIVMANSADATVTYESEPEKDIYLGIEVLGYSLYSDKVKNLVVEVDIHSLYGLTWSNSPSALKYEYGKLNIDISEILTNFNKFRDIINIKSCEVCHNNYEITYKWGIIPTGVKDHWETTYKPYPGTATLTDNDKGFILYELLKEGVLVNLKHKIIEDLPKSNALHVRCVQD